MLKHKESGELGEAIIPRFPVLAALFVKPTDFSFRRTIYFSATTF
jgi:hypothetical protein